MKLKISLFLTITLFINTGCYLYRQGKELLYYNFSAVEIEELKKDKNTDANTLNFFRLIDDLRDFAMQKIGLKTNDNYTTYVKIDKDYIVDVVSACPKDRFEPYTWWFPIMGSFPYKGFYERDDALEEAKKLKDQGYDVHVRKVCAFSTLGFFTDPIFSFMKDYSTFRIANLVIHEQTHATIFLKNNINFNEELATFVGYNGALMYLKKKFGRNSKQYRDAVNGTKDYKRYVDFVHRLYNELDTLYKSRKTPREKISERKKIFKKYKNRFRRNYSRMFSSDRFKGFLKVKLNNAFIMKYMRYTRDLSIFEKLYKKCGSDLKLMIERLRGIESSDDPKQYIRKKLI